MKISLLISFYFISISIIIIIINILREKLTRRPTRRNRVEDVHDLVTGFDAVVGRVRAVIQKVEVDTVTVVVGRYADNGGQRVRGLPPTAAGHRPRIIDQQDRVEGRKEGVRIIVQGDGGVRGGEWEGNWVTGKKLVHRIA